MREIFDETTGLSNRVVIDWKQQPKGNELKPRITLRDDDGEVIKLANGLEARYFMSVDAILSVENGTHVRAGDVIARIPPKDYAIISEGPGQVEFGKDYKTKRRIVVVPQEEDREPSEYLIPKGKHISVQEGDFVERGDLLMDGNPVPHDILDVLGVAALAEYLINEIQSVYRLQGVKINDKHIEVIVRQMLQKVEISDAGESTFLVGEQTDREEFEEINENVVKEGGKGAEASPVLQGITKASLQTRSFISAASFQETTRVLTEAAVQGKTDNLLGLKESVIVGRLIPAGTGAVMNRVKRIAAEEDRKLLEEKEKIALEMAEAEEALAEAAAQDEQAPVA
jgi:DNA-directed RNA polymerase subunit beta'